MIVVILVTSLITILIFMLTSAIYIVKIIYESTDDSIQSNDSFTGMDEQTDLTNSYLSNIKRSKHHHRHFGGNSASNNHSSSLRSSKTSSLDNIFTQKKNIYHSLSSSATTFSGNSNSNKSNLHSHSAGIGSDTSAIKHLFHDFDQRDMKLGGTGLHWCKSRATLEKLIKIGIPINITNNRHETALHVAIRRKKLAIVIGLLCYGADIECRNEEGETPLILACRTNDIYACQILLVFDANVNAKDNNGHSARHYTATISSMYKEKQKSTTSSSNVASSSWPTSTTINTTSSGRQSKRVEFVAGTSKSSLPVASDVMLAMLHEMGAARCSINLELYNEAEDDASSSAEDETNNKSDTTTTSIKRADQCPDGCSLNGTFDGDSHNRWLDYTDETFYKEFMFKDILNAKLNDSDQQQTTTINTNISNISNANSNNRSDGSTSKRSRILCIDGGGMRGAIVCQTLIELSKYLKRPVFDYFDWIGGTSVGAFLSCSICIGKDLAELRRISFCVKDEVFSGRKPYESCFIERVLKRTFGPSTRMLDVKDKKLIVTTVIADREPYKLIFFRNYKSPIGLLNEYGYFKPTTQLNKIKLDNSGPDKINSSDSQEQKLIKSIATSNSETQNGISTKDINIKQPSANIIEQIIDESDPNPLMWQAVRASAAAPFFFKPYGPYLDGGIISNNPTLDIMTEFFQYQTSRSYVRSRLASKSNNNDNDSGNNNEDDYEKHLIESNSELDLVLSLGTGRPTRANISKQPLIDLSCITAGIATVFQPVELVKSIRAIRDLFRKMLQQSCQTEDHITDRAQGWCASSGIAYYRINPPLATLFSIDDKRDEQLINALWQTKLYMKSMSKELTELATILERDN